MPVLSAPPSPTHEVGTTRFTSLATPSRGTTRTAVWTVEIAADTPPTPHSLTTEEIFVVIAGVARVRLDGIESIAATDDVIVVPAGVTIELTCGSAEPLRLLCCLPVGGRAQLADGSTFVPPWAQ